MTASSLEQLLQMPEGTPSAVVKEEVVVKQEPSLDNLVYYTIELGSCLMHLSLQACLLSLNIETPAFCSIHEFLKEQSECHHKDMYCLATSVRSMNYLMPMCQKGLLGATKGSKTTTTYDAKESLVQYYKNLEYVGYKAKDVHDMAKEVGAPDLENQIADVIHHMFTASWKVKSSLRNA